MNNKNASNKGKFLTAYSTNIVDQKSSKVLSNGQLKKSSTKPSSATQPSISSSPRRVITACVVSLLGLGTFVLDGFAVWSVNGSICDGTFNLKANTTQGLELVYTKNNCYPAQSQQANK